MPCANCALGVARGGGHGGGGGGHAPAMGGHGALFHVPHGMGPMGIAQHFGKGGGWGGFHQLVNHNSHKRRVFRNGVFTFVDLYDDEPLWIPWDWVNPTCSGWMPVDPSQAPPLIAYDAQYAASAGYTTAFFVYHGGALYAITGGSIQVCVV